MSHWISKLKSLIGSGRVLVGTCEGLLLADIFQNQIKKFDFGLFQIQFNLKLISAKIPYRIYLAVANSVKNCWIYPVGYLTHLATQPYAIITSALSTPLPPQPLGHISQDYLLSWLPLYFRIHWPRLTYSLMSTSKRHLDPNIFVSTTDI
jgi:hypothetical protein